MWVLWWLFRIQPAEVIEGLLQEKSPPTDWGPVWWELWAEMEVHFNPWLLLLYCQFIYYIAMQLKADHTAHVTQFKSMQFTHLRTTDTAFCNSHSLPSFSQLDATQCNLKTYASKYQKCFFKRNNVCTSKSRQTESTGMWSLTTCPSQTQRATSKESSKLLQNKNQAI